MRQVVMRQVVMRHGNKFGDDIGNLIRALEIVALGAILIAATPVGVHAQSDTSPSTNQTQMAILPQAGGEPAANVEAIDTDGDGVMDGQVVKIPEDLPPSFQFKLDETGPIPTAAPNEPIKGSDGTEIGTPTGEFGATWSTPGETNPVSTENSASLTPEFEKPGDFQVHNKGKREVQPPKIPEEIPPQTVDESGGTATSTDETGGTDSTAGTGNPSGTTNPTGVNEQGSNSTSDQTQTAQEPVPQDVEVDAEINTKIIDMTPPTPNITLVAEDTELENKIVLVEYPVNAPVGEKTVGVGVIGPNFDADVAKGLIPNSTAENTPAPIPEEGEAPAALVPVSMDGDLAPNLALPFPKSSVTVNINKDSGLISSDGLYLPQDVRIRYSLTPDDNHEVGLQTLLEGNTTGAKPYTIDVESNHQSAVVIEEDPDGMGGTLLFRASNIDKPAEIFYRLVFRMEDERGNDAIIKINTLVYPRDFDVNQLGDETVAGE